MSHKSLRTSRVTLGVCYYPEHWPDSLWSDDFCRMREMGLSVVRMAEFAWTIFEPEEGRFEFALFDRAMDLAEKHGLQVILGTPTAAPPAWLTHRYPEALNVSQAGVAYRHGQRRHYNYNAPIYRELCARIAGKMAEHYGAHGALVGWQIDNELNCEVDVFYSDADRAAFRLWLKERYGSLEALNAAWGATFWNQTYSGWEQIDLTGPTPSPTPNPHHALDEKRFVSHSAIAFAALQSKAIRAHDRAHFITTNGLFGHLDNYLLTEHALDFISYDSYPQFAALAREQEPLGDRKWGMNLAAVRDISPQFCVMEQQSGPGGWVNRIEQPSPKPGQVRLWTYQSIAHGADMVLYFRWRTAPYGTEIYWHGINDYSNRPNRRCSEVTRVGAEVASLPRALAGSRCEAVAALLRDYDNEWDGELDTWHGPYERQSLHSWYRALQHRHVPTDVVNMRQSTSSSDLAGYRCVVYPHAAILSERVAAVLKEYAAQGGVVIFGCRTGYKDVNGHCPMLPMPGPAADLCGVTVEDFTRIGPREAPPGILWEGRPVEAPALSSGPFNDILAAAPGTRVVAVYGVDAGYYAGRPAVVRSDWGAGAAYYFGGVFTTAAAEAFIDELGLAEPYADLASLPPVVELAIRRSETGERFLFLLNYAADESPVHLCSPMADARTGAMMSGECMLEPYGVLVLRALTSDFNRGEA